MKSWKVSQKRAKLKSKLPSPTMADEEGWVYPVGHIYQPVMVEFMSFLHGAVEYDDDQVFTREQLLEIKPIDVKRYLCMKAYEDPDPNIHNGA